MVAESGELHMRFLAGKLLNSPFSNALALRKNLHIRLQSLNSQEAKMHKAGLSLFTGMILLFLAGCSQGPVANPSSNNNSSSPNSNSAAAVSLSMTDQPPNGVTVLFFQISLTAASLTPASGSAVSLLAGDTPIQVDVTQLQAISAFLSTANVPSGTYNNLTLTFANPQLVIFNASDQTIANTCPLNTVCQLTPQVDNSSTLTFSSTPFPVTIAQNTPLGFLLDFHLDNVIQSDLSVNLGVANGVTVSQLPPLPPPGHPQFGFLFGTIQSVSASQNQFTLQTRWGRTFTVDVNSSTTYQNFPSTACATGALSCLATGDIVQVQVSGVPSDGTLLAGTVSYIQAATQQVVVGNIIGLSTANGSTVISLLLHWSPDASALPFGGIASITVPSGATFSVDSGTFTIPSGLTFASASDLIEGQTVQVDVAPGTVSSSNLADRWAPNSVSFTAHSLELEPSQITGMITAVNSSASSFTLSTLPQFVMPVAFFNSQQNATTVQTSSQTTFLAFSSDTFSGLSVNDMVSVSGWLFATPSGATASTQVAETVMGRPNGFF
jgi:Domain of unknown function (DUF4382)/Domain of unknown function (DUF5666)